MSQYTRYVFTHVRCSEKVAYVTRSLTVVSSYLKVLLQGNACQVQCRADRRRFLDFQDSELREMVDKAREMEETYGHYFDKTIVNTDLERTFDELRLAIEKLDTEAQWVPAFWVNEGRGAL